MEDFQKTNQDEDVFLNLADYINGLCLAAENIKNESLDTQVLDGFAEVIVNGVKYQVQVVLEPRANYFCKEDGGITFRKILD